MEENGFGSIFEKSPVASVYYRDLNTGRWFGINENAAETYKPEKAIQSGQTYTIEELIEYMIVYSFPTSPPVTPPFLSGGILK